MLSHVISSGIMHQCEKQQFHDHETGITATLYFYGDPSLPAIGGCRVSTYNHLSQAEHDAKQLAKAMWLKAKAHDLPLSGAKCVCRLAGPISSHQRWQFFQRLGQFIEQQGGRYIVAMDSGATCIDMDAIATTTKYVCNHSSFGDPAPYTAKGVTATIHFLARETTLGEIKYCTASLQGIGAVGRHIANQLAGAVASLRITDTRNELKYTIPQQASWVQPQNIYCQKSDFFIPCALSQSVTLDQLPLLNGSIIAGAANCPLDVEITEKHLLQQNIRYVPDFIINGGGLIYCAAEFFSKPKWINKINDIPSISIENLNKTKWIDS